jgi:hypothetical protein
MLAIDQKVRKPHAFLVVSLTLLFMPSMMLLENCFLALKYLMHSEKRPEPIVPHRFY